MLRCRDLSNFGGQPKNFRAVARIPDCIKLIFGKWYNLHFPPSQQFTTRKKEDKLTACGIIKEVYGTQSSTLQSFSCLNFVDSAFNDRKILNH